MTLELWTMESGWKGFGHFQARPCKPSIWSLTLGLPSVLGTQSPAEKLTALGCGWIQSGRSLSREDYSSSPVLSYYVNQFTDCCFSRGAYADQHNALHLNSEKSNLQKGVVFLILFDTFNNPARQIITLFCSWSTRMRRGHITLPMWLPSPRGLWSSPAQNPLSSKENTEAFVIKNHRPMGLYLSSQIMKTLWILDFMMWL